MLASAGGLIGGRLVTAGRDPATKLARDFFARNPCCACYTP